MKYLFLLVPILLVGCGDTISQSSTGSGTNSIAKDGSSVANEQHAPATSQNAEGSVSGTSTGDDYWYNEATGCSTVSHEEGRC